MLTQRERELFDDLERQFYAADARHEGTGAAPKAWLLEVAMGICVAMIAISGFLGSPESVVCSPAS